MSKKINIALMALAAVFVLTAVFTVTGHFDTLDRSISDAAHALETPALTTVLIVITNIGEWYVYVPVTLLLLIIPKTRRKVGIPVALTLVISATLNTILKLCFAIPRPDDHRLVAATGFSFPSGHAMNGAAFVGICVLLLLKHFKKRPFKIIVVVSAALLVLAIGFSRVYLGVHNPTDIVAGYAMGLFICLLILYGSAWMDGISQKFGGGV